MPSTLFAGVVAYVAQLRDHLLDLAVPYEQLTSAHFTRAISFRVLASAAIEEYVEARCLEIAAEGSDRFLHNRPTRTGPALILWFLVRTPRINGAYPLTEAEHVPDLDTISNARKAYESAVRATHGMSGKDLRFLVWPLGATATDLDPILVDLLQSWSTERDQAVHVRVKKIRQETTPDREWRTVEQILGFLRDLDDNLGRLVLAQL